MPTILSQFEENGSTLTPLRGEHPAGPLKGNGVIPINNTFSQGTYQNFVSDAPNAVDTTGNVSS